ncbi:MAG: type II secretion system protein [Candidatus Omnitrophica bacterium]|nr:type II secretion system protein [Candidatus Omnitrophota bacterium]
MNRKNDAFTLFEIVAVIIIVGLIAALALPNYVKAVNKADERNMLTNLKIMRTALTMFTGGGGTLGSWNSLSVINTNLDLNIADPKSTYTCGIDGTNGCTAVHPNGWAVQFHDEHSSGLIHCSAGTCPSCPAQPGNCE